MFTRFLHRQLTWGNSVQVSVPLTPLLASTNHHIKLLSRKEYEQQHTKYVKTLSGLSNRSNL